ncbi:unnamed protein product [Camellia sinensis]
MVENEHFLQRENLTDDDMICDFPLYFKSYVKNHQLLCQHKYVNWGWVFWSGEDNPCERPPPPPPFSNLTQFLAQFWKVIEIEGKHLLTTRHQPFGFDFIHEGLCQYRLMSLDFEFDLDGLESTPNVQYYSCNEYPQFYHAYSCNINQSVAFPLFESSTRCCIGVIEVVLTDKRTYRTWGSFNSNRVLRKEKLCNVVFTNDRTYDRERQKFAFLDACAKHCLRKGQGVVGRVVLSQNLVFCKDVTQFSITEYPLAHYARKYGLTGSFAICLRSSYIEDNVYMLEFFLPPNYIEGRDPRIALVPLLTTMKQHCKSFKVASGKELGEELSIEVLDFSEDGKLCSYQIPQTARTPNRMENGEEMVLLDLSNQQLLEVDAVDTGNNVVSNTEENNNVVTSVQQNSSQRLQRKAGIPISLDDLQQHFGMKLKDAAQSLGVSRSTVKRVCREYNITWCPPCKRSKDNQLLSNKPVQGGVQEQILESSQLPISDPPHMQDMATASHTKPHFTAAQDTNIVTIKAKYGDDFIKFQLPVSSRMVDKLGRAVVLRPSFSWVSSVSNTVLNTGPQTHFAATTNSTAIAFSLLHSVSYSGCRKKRINKRLIMSKMAEFEEMAVTFDVKSGNIVFQPVLEEGVFRFYCIADHRNAAFPSLSFVNPKDRDTPIMTSHNVSSYIPSFECVLGEQIVQIELSIGTSFYGTGEVSGQLERTGKRVFTWNMVAGAYGPGTTSLYQSHPWVLAVLPSREALGVLADTTRRCEINLQKESIIKFVAPSSYPVITFGPFASPTDVLISLSHAVEIVLYLCRQSGHWGIINVVGAMTLMHEFVRLPEHFGRKERFPDPKSLVKDLRLTGFKAIWMLDPGIKNEEGYFVYDSGSKLMSGFKQLMENLLLVWPGPCVFPDFTLSKTRSWWASLVKDFISKGVDGIWNDMNEPAVFKAVTKTMPETNVHRGDVELGVYGMLMARSAYEGMKLSNENNCPFVLTRAGFIGSQRYAATWTGDNLCTWEHLHMSISMVLQLGLSGQPLSGPDIGGFEGNATPKLFGRWMGLGAMFPFCRGHSDTGTVDHEPWSFGEEGRCEEVCRLALKRSQRSQAKNTGKFIYVGTITNIYKERGTVSDQGIDQLQLVLPKGIWLSFDFDDSHPDLPVLYLQGGSIIPLGPAIQHVGEANPIDDLSLLVALDGKAKGVLFEDDGDGYEFTGGGYLLTTYVAELESSVVTVRISEAEGSWKRSNVVYTYNYYLVDLDAWGIDGEVLQIMMPSEDEVSNLVFMSEKQYKIRMENAKRIPEVEKVSGLKGVELSRGTQWLHSRVEVDGYEEFSGTEYRSAGWSEEYAVIEESLMLGDIGSGVVIERDISFLKIVPTMIDNMMSDFPHNLISYVNNNQFLCDRGVFSGGFVFSTLQHHPPFQPPPFSSSHNRHDALDLKHTC